MDRPEEVFNLHKDDDSEYMKADREFFRQNPDKEFYVRKRFAGEMIEGNPPNVVVQQVAEGFRMRFPCSKDSITDRDIAEITKELQDRRKLATFERMITRKGKLKKSKKINKGFGKI
ncbi:hypothetical protein IQ255_07840 [Pleurocapsales cyanobacterium LEGE 10410]|nr:hypothetical protein [Pleurocapsales cyanobacterium LEGE 10410]